MTLQHAPLIEVIFELRWGQVKHVGPKGVDFSFDSTDKDFFIGQFKNIVNKHGYSYEERVNEGIPLPGLPHFVSWRFREKENEWPCLQIGLGIFTVNQVNDGYKWNKFKDDILNGLNLLNEGHPLGLSNLPALGVELRYQDGFYLEDDETALDFLNKKLELNFSPPKNFFSHESIVNEIQGNKISFALGLKKPVGIIIIDLDKATINGKDGFVMTTTVRSADNAKPEFSIPALEKWIVDAHTIHKHAFDTLISKTYQKTFQ